jgi:hypothetical protein
MVNNINSSLPQEVLEVYLKVPEIRLPTLNYSLEILFACTSFEVVPFCVNTAIQQVCLSSEALTN